MLAAYTHDGMQHALMLYIYRQRFNSGIRRNLVINIKQMPCAVLMCSLSHTNGYRN